MGDVIFWAQQTLTRVRHLSTFSLEMLWDPQTRHMTWIMIVATSRPGDSFEVKTDHAERGDVGPYR